MNFLENVLNFLYPQTCGICEKISKEPICKHCKLKLDKITFSNRKCFLEVNGIYYDEHMYLFKYEGIIKEKIKEYKFRDQSYLYKFFAGIINYNNKINNYIQKYDYIIPIPLHKYRYNKRGYNQTYLILKELNKKQHIKILNDVLIKKKNIKPQSSLNKIDRANNIKNAYEIKNIKKIQNKKILLFDDIFTTGNTTNECSRILKENGAIKVGVLTIAKD